MRSNEGLVTILSHRARGDEFLARSESRSSSFSKFVERLPPSEPSLPTHSCLENSYYDASMSLPQTSDSWQSICAALSALHTDPSQVALSNDGYFPE